MGSAAIFKAAISIALYSSGTTFENRQFFAAENASAFEFSAQEEEKTLRDFTVASGGIDAAVKRLSGMGGKIDLRHFTPSNLAQTLWGTTASLAATAIVGEAGYKIVPSARIPTKRLLDTTVAPVVKKGATVILAADYTYDAHGLIISPTITTGTVVSGDAITIDYTPLLSTDVQPFVSAAPDVSILVAGINEVTQKYIVAKFFKCKLGAIENLPFIGEDFAVLGCKFTPQLDSSIVTAGKSKYFEIQQAT